MAKNFTWTDKAILSWIDIWARIWSVKTVLDSRDVKTNLCSWVWQVGDVYVEPSSNGSRLPEVLTRESDFLTFHTISAIPLPGLEGVYAIRRECGDVVEGYGVANWGPSYADDDRYLIDELVEVVANINLWLVRLRCDGEPYFDN